MSLLPLYKDRIHCMHVHACIRVWMLVSHDMQLCYISCCDYTHNYSWQCYKFFLQGGGEANLQYRTGSSENCANTKDFIINIIYIGVAVPSFTHVNVVCIA